MNFHNKQSRKMVKLGWLLGEGRQVINLNAMVKYSCDT